MGIGGLGGSRWDVEGVWCEGMERGTYALGGRVELLSASSNQTPFFTSKT